MIMAGENDIDTVLLENIVERIRLAERNRLIPERLVKEYKRLGGILMVLQILL